MNPVMRRTAVISALLHLVVILALLISLPVQKLPDADNGTSFDVQFESMPKAPAKGPAARRSPTPSAAPTQPTPPTPKPVAPNTAPPPPPPKTEAAPTPPTPAKPIPTPPAPTPTPTSTPVKVEQPKPVQTQATTTSIPTPPEPVAAPPSQSTTSQPNQTKNPVDDSEALLNTLAKLKSTTKSDQAPTAVANPDSGGATEDSGNPNSNDTSQLSAGQIGAIGDLVKQCWTRDAEALHADQLQVTMQVTTRPGGIAYKAQVVGDDETRMQTDPVFRAFAERAVRAVLDARCSTFPLPASMQSSESTFTFLFKP